MGERKFPWGYWGVLFAEYLLLLAVEICLSEIPSLSAFFSRALQAAGWAINAMGTTWLGLLAPILIASFFLLLEGYRHGRGAMREHWRRNLQNSAIATGGVLYLVFLWHFVFLPSAADPVVTVPMLTPKVTIGMPTLLNEKTQRGYQTHIPLKIVSPFSIGSLRITVRVKTLIDFSPSSSEHGLLYNEGTVVDGQKFVDIENAYGDLALIIDTAEPITEANPIAIEPHVK